MILILLIVLAVFLLGGTWGAPRFGYPQWSPMGVVLLVLLILLLTGNLSLPR